MPLIRVAEAARLMQCATSTVYRRMRRVGMPFEAGQRLDTDRLVYHKLCTAEQVTTYLTQPPPQATTQRALLLEMRQRLIRLATQQDELLALLRRMQRSAPGPGTSPTESHHSEP